MTGNSVQYIRTQNIALAENSSSALREGSVVSVKVLKNLGGGKFTVFAGGNRFNVTSAGSLKPGDVFTAQVSISSDGTVILRIRPDSFSQAGSGGVNELASLLEKMGLFPDDVNLKLVSFLQQSGVKIDRILIARARTLAKLFPGKEKLASEAAALLLEKGIEPDEELVAEFILSCGEDDGKKHQKNFNNQHKKQKDAPAEGECFLKKLYPAPVPNTDGLLTFMNHLKEKDGKHWLILPFEWKDDEAEASSGKIRLLLDPQRKLTEKISISCNKSGKKYFFVLYFNQSMVKEVRFCTLPPLLTEKIPSSEKRLGELFGSGMNLNDSVSVNYSTSALTDGLCSNEEVPVSFEINA